MAKRTVKKEPQMEDYLKTGKHPVKSSGKIKAEPAVNTSEMLALTALEHIKSAGRLSTQASVIAELKTAKTYLENALKGMKKK